MIPQSNKTQTSGPKNHWSVWANMQRACARQVQKLESMHCHAAARAWRTMLGTIERLQTAQARGAEKSSNRETAG